MEEKYLPELMAEKDSLDPSFTHALRLVNQEIEKFQKGEGKDEEKYIDVVINKNMKLGQKVLIPVKQFPKFNFVGKLLGPRGNSLKRLQEETLTKMSILGKGSMRDKAKEEELRKSGEAKYFHLNDDLHVLIEVFAPPAEAYARMGHALEEIKKFLIPDYNDEIRQAQLQELTYLNGGSENADVPVVRGKPTLRTRGVPTPAITRGRGGVTTRPVGVGVPRGTPASRGVLSTRGPVSRGRGLLTPRARGVPPTGYRPPPPPPTQETYGDYDYDDGYGTAYDEQSYDSYDNSYSTPAQRVPGPGREAVHRTPTVCADPALARHAGLGSVTHRGHSLCAHRPVAVANVSDAFISGADYYDYGHGLSEEAYDSYGQEDWANSRHKAPAARTAKGVYRDQPYGRY
ncbi:KH domain-containing, RNA-binding, signal transduction-associated protein 3 isoform 3-T4 [Lycaon pictus]|uniref:KH RNA binding domain containing, signal transduction associated 3 n=3 Tax=Canis lupus TaxID=9612 RepID=A0A8C0Q9T8_CANLF|nr:KH domain-containing, RNA-binding, signal transduction-associated protein 3 isoform X3 [Canis lupus familiaris]XP_038541016.1 KH domain-containing, RNA-binding, signal transduction-associated protein 3 isoform X3 [Canis lupus familiaris]XP_048948730.1 KH domain-containing, RNA-binding, signal transduction-associated protein 3 isoform X2 [Canis lupus dingo]XP_055170212.1 KH domain-containing, RNA-binding, signal transduction-associated protein 3 isoform X1 [Nyctereutes procyonoides]XP_0551702|eukprot:XP_848348.2 KH domain-containing, RNA-binding, signal transduction-associated protein 3 isoform X2 [Canis lupus familiaris]